MINKIYQYLKEVYDPEIPLDIVNLGLIKSIDFDGKNLNITLTLTTPNCPLEDIIISSIEKKIKENIAEIENITITLDFSTPWTTNQISQEGKEKLRTIGWKI